MEKLNLFWRIVRSTCMISLLCLSGARAQVYERVYSFTDARSTDAGRSPTNTCLGVIQGSDGNFYGTTFGGGLSNGGTVFKISPAGVLTTLVDFTGASGISKGSGPNTLVQSCDGNFYGTTVFGGANECGTVFKVSPAGVFTTIVEFVAPSGNSPWAGLVQGADGNFYGTTANGGASDCGTVFKMTPSGVLTTLAEFTGTSGNCKGNAPLSALIQGNDGSFYGTTVSGGASDFGTVFKVTPSGVLTTIVEFTGNGTFKKGREAEGALVQGVDGNFYGTTRRGGAGDIGTIFKITPNGVLTTLVEFTGTSGNNKGRNPCGALAQGSDGNFYGTTPLGGGYDSGTVFKITPSGVLTTLMELGSNATSNIEIQPIGALMQADDGNFYGTTGGTGNATVFKMTQAGALTTFVEFAGSSLGLGLTAALVQGSDGNFYGTTSGGGASNDGTVFKITSAGIVTTLVQFTGIGGSSKGDQVFTALIQGKDGNFYGTTGGGGASFYGTVFKMTSAGAMTTLVEFTGNGTNRNGSRPMAALVQGTDGNLYGTTSEGGDGSRGTVFKITPSGMLTTLVHFTGTSGARKGSYPYAALVQGSDGSFYGTTNGGGSSDCGTVFKVSPSGTFTTLVEFNGIKDMDMWNYPHVTLVCGSDGNFYGTTYGGGANNCGTVFKMTSAGALTTLVDFTGTSGNTKGSTPCAALMQGSDGNLYGTTFGGGGSDCGTVFRMSPAGVLTTLLEFSSPDQNPMAPLIEASDGTLYGTVYGPNGAIYRLIFPGAPLIFIRDPQVQGVSAALVQASVNARGNATTVSLEYGIDGSNFPNTMPIAVNLMGYLTKLVGTTLTNLAQGTTYFYRFRCVSSAGTTVSSVRNFSTLAAPLVTIIPASNVLPTSATLNAAVNPRNYETAVRFEYGTDGNTFPISVSPIPSTVTGAVSVPFGVAIAGLAKGTTYYYRVIATNAGGTTISGQGTFTTLTEPTASVAGVVPLSTVSAQVSGTLNPHGSLTQIAFEYGTDGVTFPNSVSATPATGTGNSDLPVTAILTNLSQGITYFYRIKGMSDGGVGISAAGSFTMNVLSGFAQSYPGNPPDAQGYVFITLNPSGIASGWRFVGEQQWRPSNVLVSGLTTGDRQIEFRPVPGYIQPMPETVSVISGGAPTFLTFEYYDTIGSTAGGLCVVLKPDSLADAGVPTAQRAQWRLLGEDDTQWRDSGVTINGLVPGAYLVECKPVTGRTTPANISLSVTEGQTPVAVATYYLANTQTGVQPSVLSFDTVTSSRTLPYAFVGQIRSDAGSSTGFVVKPRVVATAAHVVFDDGSLSYVTGLQWLFQRDRGTYEPVPQVPRGFYIFDGYAAQRTAEGTPGVSTPMSQNLDAAAMYFLEDAGRGGYGGYLASDSVSNEFLLSSRLKMLVGYPVDGIPASNQGRMFATPSFDIPFAQAYGRTYTSTAVTSVGGNSGGPLCILHDNGNYYPAAIYLGGDSETVVRAIDSSVVDLFNRAEVSGNGGDDNTGGGITQVNTTLSGGAFSAASIKVSIVPASAVTAGAKWKLGSSTTLYPSGQQTNNLSPGTYSLGFTAATGFLTPSAASITLTSGNLSTVTRTYYGIITQPVGRTVNAQESVTFTVGVSGTPTAYQWRRNGVNIAGATSPSYTRSNLTAPDSGNYSVYVTWGTDGSLLSSPATLDVNTLVQSISFPALSNQVDGAPALTLRATASSGLPVTYTVLSGPATVSGNVLTATGCAPITVRASQAGSTSYDAATSVDRSFTVLGINVQPQDVAVNAQSDATFGVTVSGAPTAYQWLLNGLAITGATNYTYTRPRVSAADAGNYCVLVTWGATGSVISKIATLDVTLLSQAISFGALSNRLLSGPSLMLGGTSSSGLPVGFELVSGPATLNGNVLTPTGYGTVTVRASQAGDGNYSVAASVDRSFQVIGETPDTWRARVFTADELANPQVSGPGADFDRDGISNLMEFALNLDPKISGRRIMTAVTGTGGLPLVRCENIGGQSRLTMEYVRRTGASTPGISCTVEFSSNLANPAGWSSGGTEAVTPIDATWERVKVTDPQPASPSRFSRLKVTQP